MYCLLVKILDQKLPATGVCTEFLHEEEHKGLSMLVYLFLCLTSLFCFGLVFSCEDWFQQQALTEVHDRVLILYVKYKKEDLAMIDAVSAAVYDTNKMLL